MSVLGRLRLISDLFSFFFFFLSFFLLTDCVAEMPLRPIAFEL